MGLEYWPCYHSYRKKCEKLTDQELGRLVRSLMIYSETGERQELAGRESIAFDFIADDIDRAKENYESRCESMGIRSLADWQRADDERKKSREEKTKNPPRRMSKTEEFVSMGRDHTRTAAEMKKLMADVDKI